MNHKVGAGQASAADVISLISNSLKLHLYVTRFTNLTHILRLDFGLQY